MQRQRGGRAVLVGDAQPLTRRVGGVQAGVQVGGIVVLREIEVLAQVERVPGNAIDALPPPRP